MYQPSIGQWREVSRAAERYGSAVVKVASEARSASASRPMKERLFQSRGRRAGPSRCHRSRRRGGSQSPMGRGGLLRAERR